jgi:formate hydrogenlyase subunit 3/multisubunit Na+/H+ antiporter MnhD subunit
MRLIPKNSRTWNAFVLLILGLAIAVFAWGLRYKLSLYETAPPSSHHVVLAKLLSNRERPADTAIRIERATMPSLAVVCVAFTLFAGLLLDPKRQAWWTLQRVQNSQRRLIPFAARRVFFRPPPSRSK